VSSQEFNSLVVTNAESLTPFAISLTRDHEAAKDLCQETLCRAFIYKEKYQTGTNLKAWLYTIMRNIFINDYRRNARKKVVMETVGYYEPAYTATQSGGISFKEIQTAIYNLPAIFKTACLLYFQGYKYQEIAEVLNEPLGTIKSRIHFARKLLQKQTER